MDSPNPSATRNRRIDPRGQRFAAALTSGVLVAVLILGPTPPGYLVLVWQLLVFAVGAALGPAATPYARAFRAWVVPRIGPPAELEDAAPPRFAQGVGLVFAVVGLVSWALGPDGWGLTAPDLTALGTVAVAFALGAALLNAVFGICLGCQLYIVGLRLVRRRRTSPAAGVR